MKKPVLLANGIGFVVFSAAFVGMTVHARAQGVDCATGNHYVCAENCEPETNWSMPIHCCNDVGELCCVRVCFNYDCIGINCQHFTSGIKVGGGTISTIPCLINPGCGGGP